MAQSNAVQDQPSMEDILTSIRRIIDDGNSKSSSTSVPTADEVANDDAVEAAPKTPAVKGEITADTKINEIPELDSFLEALDAKYTAQQQSGDSDSDQSLKSEGAMKLHAEQGGALSDAEAIDSSIAMIDEAMGIKETSQKDSSKYEARFSEDDRSAFAAVGDVLSGNKDLDLKVADTAPAATSSADDRPTALISEPVRARVGGSLNNLSEALAQEAQRQLPQVTETLLKPMLADWLDNNLPSMVERLVREEIERIARGD